MSDASEPEFDYSNLSGRRPGPFVTVAGWLLPGVARVQDAVTPYAAAWHRNNVAALGSGSALWVALGDSLTQGIGAPSYDRGWVGQARDRLVAAGRDLHVVNLAVSGAKTRDILDRQLPALEVLQQGGADIELVTLMVGSNDLMRPSNRRALAGHFEQMLRRLPSGAVVTTLPNPSPVAGEVNTVIERIARERGLVVAELRDPRTTSWRGKLAADHFHPNERGYAAIAEVVADVVLGSGRAA